MDFTRLISWIDRRLIYFRQRSVGMTFSSHSAQDQKTHIPSTSTPRRHSPDLKWHATAKCMYVCSQCFRNTNHRSCDCMWKPKAPPTLHDGFRLLCCLLLCLHIADPLYLETWDRPLRLDVLTQIKFEPTRLKHLACSFQFLLQLSCCNKLLLHYERGRAT